MSQGRIREVASGSMSSWLTRAPAYLNSLPISIFYRYLLSSRTIALTSSTFEKLILVVLNMAA